MDEAGGTSDLWAVGGVVEEVARDARLFHWPIEFPDVMAGGGFDVAIGNPPWERIKIQEQEFFALRAPEIAMAATASVRGKMIAALLKAEAGEVGWRLHSEFELAKRVANASSVFARDGGRFPLTGRGDVNTYALFAELLSTLVRAQGRSGAIVPSGVGVDDTNRFYFQSLVKRGRLVSFLSFYEIRLWFKDTDDRKAFCLLTTGTNSGPAEFSFHIREITELAAPERRFPLTEAQIAHLNPNTETAPVSQTPADVALAMKIYSHLPIMIREGSKSDGNPWDMSFMAMFHMANDSDLFHSEFGPGRVPLIEAKMVHQFDHRWSSYRGGKTRDLEPREKADPNFEPLPRHWIDQRDVHEKLAERAWSYEWLVGWRDVTSAHVYRTLVACAIPATAVGDKFLLLFPRTSPSLCAALLGCLNSLVCDYVARQKLGGYSFKYYLMQQLPVIPPTRFSDDSLRLIVPRIAELSYTSHSMAPFARDLGCTRAPFAWDEDRRAQIRAELDAWYAHAYGVTRDELRYILDPADVMGKDYQSETFRVLKNDEMKKYGEYRTRRLVLEAWDRLEAGDLK